MAWVLGFFSPKKKVSRKLEFVNVYNMTWQHNVRLTMSPHFPDKRLRLGKGMEVT